MLGDQYNNINLYGYYLSNGWGRKRYLFFHNPGKSNTQLIVDIAGIRNLTTVGFTIFFNNWIIYLMQILFALVIYVVGGTCGCGFINAW